MVFLQAGHAHRHHRAALSQRHQHLHIRRAEVWRLACLTPRFDPEDLLAIIQREQITHLHLVPTMFVRLLRLPEAVRAKYDTSSLEMVVHGAAPLPHRNQAADDRVVGPDHL